MGFLAWFSNVSTLTTRACIWGRAEGGIFDFCKVCRGFCGLGGFREGFIPMQRYFLRGDDLPQGENGGDRFTMVARGHYGPSLQISRLLCLGEGIYNI